MAYTKTLRSYRFIDKNPVIDVVRTAIQDAGLIKRLRVVAELASLSEVTVDNWLNGDVRDPRHSSIMAVMIALGWEQSWRQGRKLNLEQELEFARAWNKKERQKAEAAREAEAPAAKRRRKRKAAKKRKVA